MPLLVLGTYRGTVVGGEVLPRRLPPLVTRTPPLVLWDLPRLGRLFSAATWFALFIKRQGLAHATAIPLLVLVVLMTPILPLRVLTVLLPLPLR